MLTEACAVICQLSFLKVVIGYHTRAHDARASTIHWMRQRPGISNEMSNLASMLNRFKTSKILCIPAQHHNSAAACKEVQQYQPATLQAL